MGDTTQQIKIYSCRVCDVAVFNNTNSVIQCSGPNTLSGILKKTENNIGREPIFRSIILECPSIEATYSPRGANPNSVLAILYYGESFIVDQPFLRFIFFKLIALGSNRKRTNAQKK